jgi:hypothetical protein
MYKTSFLYLAQDVESLSWGSRLADYSFLGTNHRALDYMIFKGIMFHEHIL